MDLQYAQNVLTRYGAALEGHRDALPFGLPESALPHPRIEIQEAIRTLYTLNQDPRVELQLENSLLLLSSFSPELHDTVSDLSAPGAAERVQRMTLAAQAAMSEVHALRRTKAPSSPRAASPEPAAQPASAAPAAALGPIRQKAEVNTDLEGIRRYLLTLAPRLEARQPGLTAQLQKADLRQPLMMMGKGGEGFTVIFEPQGDVTVIKVEARPPAAAGKLRGGFWRWSRRTAIRLFLKRAKRDIEKLGPAPKADPDAAIVPEVLPPER